MSAKEWKELVASDLVLQFIERVNEQSPNNPLWNTNYALALYHTFGEEARHYTIEKYHVANFEIGDITAVLN